MESTITSYSDEIGFILMKYQTKFQVSLRIFVMKYLTIFKLFGHFQMI